jgi:FKBP-type peptidyl-prolyl cis-trans isomerase FklB
MRLTISRTALILVILPAASVPAWAQNAASKQAPAAAAPAQDAATLLPTEEDRVSYALGWDIGRNSAEMFKAQGITVKLAILFRGLQHGFTGQKPLMTENQCEEILAKVGEQIQEKQQKEFQALAAANKAEGEKFLAANGKRPGVVTLPSGLQIEILTKGTGKTPAPESNVTTHYHGTLINGTVFDSSVDRKEPATFPVKIVIKGWQEALAQMKEGDKWKLYIPSDLAYNEQGYPPIIGPNETLIFEMELLKVN